MVKVLWRSHEVEEAIWEAKEDMNSKYPFIFPILENRAKGMCYFQYLCFLSMLKVDFEFLSILFCISMVRVEMLGV